MDPETAQQSVQEPVQPEIVETPEGMESPLDASGIEQPGKVMRIATMVRQLLDEVRHAQLDEASRARLREIYETSVRELSEVLAPDLKEELERLSIPFGSDTPSDAELRIAHAQLIGWLEGLFHGIQAALFSQQMAARAQFEELRRRGLPGTSDPQAGTDQSRGQYL